MLAWVCIHVRPWCLKREGEGGGESLILYLSPRNGRRCQTVGGYFQPSFQPISSSRDPCHLEELIGGVYMSGAENNVNR